MSQNLPSTLAPCNKLEETLAAAKRECPKLKPSDNMDGVGIVGTSLKITSKFGQEGVGGSKNRKKSNPNCLLLQDTNVDCFPPPLKSLLDSYDVETLTPSQLLTLLIYMACLESGFVSEKIYLKCNKHINKISSSTSYDSENVRSLAAIKPTFIVDNEKKHFSIRLHTVVDSTEPDTKRLNSMLNCVVTGDYMVVTLTPEPSTDLPGRSIMLSIPRYVPVSGKTVVHKRLRKIDELVLKLRDNILVPIRNQQMMAIGAQIYPSLIGLPNELYDNILQYLNKNQLNILANVSTKLNVHAVNAKNKIDNY